MKVKKCSQQKTIKIAVLQLTLATNSSLIVMMLIDCTIDCKLRYDKNTYYGNLCWCRKWRGRFFLFALFGKIRGSIVIKEFLQTSAGHIVIYHICPGKRMRIDRPQRISSNLML